MKYFILYGFETGMFGFGRLVIFGADYFIYRNPHASPTWRSCIIQNNSIMGKSKQQQLSSVQQATLLETLKSRFEKNMARHKGLKWADVAAKLAAAGDRLWSLHIMEETGGEPDVVGFDKKTGVYTFYDCAAETPVGRRNVCYDREALESRKEHKPADNAVDMAAAIGITLLTEEQYRELQQLGKFDLKTSSWVETPPAIRKLGGALFCDRRYDHVFTYHNGASSYYAVRGFRGALQV